MLKTSLRILSPHRQIHTCNCMQKQIPRNLKGKDIHAQKWLIRQLNDPYVKRAKKESYRCRSAFKLIEIDDEFHILTPGQIVIDCGAAPGSWSQVAVERVHSLGFGKEDSHNSLQGKVIGIDLKHITPINGATLLGNCDFTKMETSARILEILDNSKVDVVMSDMAPNATGIKSFDHDIIIELCMKAFSFSITVLKPRGTFLCKIWQGQQQKTLEELLRKAFQSVRIVKPLASRGNSAECFLLAQKYKLAA